MRHWVADFDTVQVIGGESPMKTKRVLTGAVASLLVLLPTLGAAGPASAHGRPEGTQGKPEFVADELLVAFKEGTPANERAAAHSQAGGRMVRQIRSLGVDVVKVQGPAERRIQGYQNNPRVEYVELNGIAYVDAWPDAGSAPSDAEYTKQWGLHNTGQDGGKLDADIDAPEAWQKTTGSSSVTVAIVDTGVTANHPDLEGKFAELSDWANASHDDPSDGHGHGTHVAGTVAAKTNNGAGVAGVCPGCELISARVCDSNGGCNYDWIASGVLWAVGCEERKPDTSTDFGECTGTQRAKVINLSLGGTYKSVTLERAIKRAWDRGTVLACAAGNNSNTVAFYPAAFSQCIAVAATDRNDRKASFSNFGGWVDVAAPGVSIVSTVKTGGYESWSGTSMASPHVAGLAGLLWANGADNQASVRSKIESSAVNISGTGRQWAKGRISACRALEAGDCGKI
jgi:thermitase